MGHVSPYQTHTFPVSPSQELVGATSGAWKPSDAAAGGPEYATPPEIHWAGFIKSTCILSTVQHHRNKACTQENENMNPSKGAHECS